MVTWEWKSVKQGDRDEEWNKGGSRDEQRTVGDGMEIEQRWIRGEEWRCSREGAEQNRVCQRSTGDPVSNRVPLLWLAFHIPVQDHAVNPSTKENSLHQLSTLLHVVVLCEGNSHGWQNVTQSVSVSLLKSLLVVWSLTSEMLSLRRCKWLEGHWLQLMCCTLPKHLCP